MNINKHYELILKKYNLEYLHKKYMFFSILTVTLREGFYWLLLIFSEYVKKNESLVSKYASILVSILGIYIPVERQFINIRSNLIEKIKLSNNDYFNDRIINMSKKELLNFDLVEYFNILDQFNKNLEYYIINMSKKFDIPVKSITILVIAINKKFSILIGLIVIYYGLVRSLNEHKNIKEIKLSKEYFKYENIIRNYVINGKNFLINDEFNKEYLIKNLSQYEDINYKIQSLNDDLNMNVNLIMFALIIIVIRLKISELNHLDFFYYFLIVYDVEFIGDMINEYYKTQVGYIKMNERLTFLNSFIPEIKNVVDKTKILNIKINKINNKKPLLVLNKSINIDENDHILVNGESGSGKTTLLYILKGIVKSDTIDISPKIENINYQTYLTLPNHKSLYNGNLYDIISNYDKNVNINLIEHSLIKSKISDRLNKNEFIDIETLSGGERIRLLIARLIYTIKTLNYNILLFDEIDENLNDELAIEICNNLMDVFKDKIILYITHNESVKELFKKKIFIRNGIITD
jgi:ABC-type lipoprotein export system ATPase subunit